MNGRVEVEAVFGSMVRGDRDGLSDRDILIMDDDLGALRERQLSLESEGWSVASYTYPKLCELARRGALFIQHLKLESSIVDDKRGRLYALLENFEAKESYQAEVRDNSVLARLAGTRPQSARGALWAADVLYVALRNFGVLTLAEKKRFTFSFAGIVDALAECGIVPNEAKGPLLRLRPLKSAYRAGVACDEQEVSQALQAALSVLPHTQFPEVCFSATPAAVISACRSSATCTVAYHRLRNLERGYVALLECDADFASHVIFQRVAEWVKNPRCYSGMAADLSDQLIDEMYAQILRLPSRAQKLERV